MQATNHPGAFLSLYVGLGKFRFFPTVRPRHSVLVHTHGLDLVKPVQQPGSQFGAGGATLKTLELYYCKEVSPPFQYTKANWESLFFRSILPFRNDSFYKWHLERRRKTHCPLLGHRGPWCLDRELEPQIKPSSRDNFKTVLCVPLILLGKQMMRFLKKKTASISLSFLGTLCLNNGFSRSVMKCPGV